MRLIDDDSDADAADAYADAYATAYEGADHTTIFEEEVFEEEE